MRGDQIDMKPPRPEAKSCGETSVVLVRGPLVSSTRALNNEATPAIGLAHISGYLEQFGYKVALVDGIGEGLNDVWSLDTYGDHIC